MPVRDSDPPLDNRLVISECQDCRALKIESESKGMCCANGCVPPIILFRPDDHIIQLYRGNTAVAILFRSKIRWFNSCFGLSAFQCNEESRRVTKDGISISGVSYHSVPPLRAPDGTPMRYSQLYILDADYQLDLRLRQTNSVENILQRSIFEQLNGYLLSHHSLFPTVKAAYEMVQNYDNYRIVLEETDRVIPQRRQFSAVRVNELALLYPENAFREGKVPGIVLNHRQGGGSTRVDQYSSLYFSSGYPLIFFDGQPGWGRHSVRVDEKRLSLAAWSRYLFFERSGVFNPVLESCNLSKQFALDTKQRMEWVLHQWYRQNQSKIRVDTAANVEAARSENQDPSSIGKRVILTAAAKGSPRWYHQRYLNAMEIVAMYGAPSLFVTITCNQKWAEIADLMCHEKYSGWTASDRPDLVARIFNCKLNRILKDIHTNQVFGEVIASCYSIEWQKRGNPHAHCVFWLSQEDKLDTVPKVDSAISAVIPPPEQSELRELVLKHMIHGPCGTRNSRSPCMEVRNGQRVCTKQFPKAFSSETIIGEDCYARYARPSPENGGQTAMKGSNQIDNRDVVPYNPWLLQRYGSHINVEKVCSVKSLRYIFKYTFKGCDMATYRKVSVDGVEQEVLDEISNAEEGRYLSIGEAVWDIFEFARHGNTPPVVQLDLHLEGENNVVFDPETGIESVETSRSTKLTAFFKLNQVDSAARLLLYNQIPSYFVYKGKKWVRRSRGERDEGVMNLRKVASLGRIPFVNPSTREKNEVFALYLLLCHVRGPKSYEDLRTVDGTLYSTNVAAAEARSLMTSEDFIERAMQDAMSHMTGWELRSFFAMLLVFWHGKDARSFFDSHLEDLCDDFLNTARRENPGAGLNQQMVDRCLVEIGQHLLDLGSSL